MNHYINDEGNTVFTSEYHRKKGSCCKSSCLHCPYGTTLKKCGVVLTAVSPHNEAEVHALFKTLFEVGDSVSQSLLANAFGKSEQVLWIPKEFFVLSLKQVICGMAQIKQGKVERLKLLPHFSQQGITESYLNSLV